MRRRLAAGNWKMNGLFAALSEAETLSNAFPDPGCDIVLCPPATLLSAMSTKCKGGGIAVGGQDCHRQEKGAHTGEISAEMLYDAGARYVILGHSERRAEQAETDAQVRQKAKLAWNNNLISIICVGESEKQRLGGGALDVIASQLAGSVPDGATGENLVVAYEPIWAIGTGRIPTLGEIGEMHDFMRQNLGARFGSRIAGSVRLLYGGSMNPGNVADIIKVANVDGGLVGGASLKADDFSKIVRALSAK